jgi:AcrR family transcriptional regulator
MLRPSVKKSERVAARRHPKQERSRQTVEVVLEGVQWVLKREGARAITTNRIAEAAGVSVGSLYQYFPDKQAIFAALHDRHVDEVRGVMERTSADCGARSLEDFTRELVDGLASLHADNAELHEVVSAAVPASAHGFQHALQSTFERVMVGANEQRHAPNERGRMLFVLPHLIEGLVHGVARQKQAFLSRGSAKDEAIRTVLVYLSSCRPGPRNTH